MPFVLPELPFAPDALAPWTSAETFEYHHGKHHAGYVKKLNAAVEGTRYAESPLIEVIKDARAAGDAGVFNNAAQHWNHGFFWECLSVESQIPEGEIRKRIDETFGSYETFMEQFSAKALSLFGSGWAWLVRKPNGLLTIEQYKDAETPAGTDATPLLTLDVWEHAYYIDHRNDRAKFIEGFWRHVDWAAVNERLRS